MSESARRDSPYVPTGPPTNMVRKVRNQRLRKAYSLGFIDSMLCVGGLVFALWSCGVELAR